MSEFTVPRCGHGNIILGCPDDDCEEQNAYLLQQSAALDRFQALQREAVFQLIRDMVKSV